MTADPMVQDPGSSVTVGGSLAGWELVLLIGVLGAVLIGLTWPITRAWARRIAGQPVDDRLVQTQIQLDQALARLAEAETRIGELEGRLDFAERILPTPEHRDPLAPTPRVTTPRP